jgi:7-cyano-7-deazaguanine synthase
VEVGTKGGVDGEAVRILAPLVNMSKAEIIAKAAELNAPLALTWSCYLGGPTPCGRCDSCRLREAGFRKAGLADPSLESQGV